MSFWRKALNIGRDKGKGIPMKPYRISGTFLMGESWSPFTKEVAGKDENDAVERLVSDLGSKHRVKRRNIKISSVERLKEKEVEDPLVGFLIKRGA
ncbi:MAG: 50S ribosomal protein L18Ae [Thermoplasmata archaeon]